MSERGDHIEHMLTLLAHAWCQHPDYTLGQVVYAAWALSDTRTGFWNIEDADISRGLESMVQRES